VRGRPWATRCNGAAARFAVAGTALELTDPVERAVASATRLILDHRALTDAEYAEAAAILGAARLFALTTLVGYHELPVLQPRVFGVDEMS
jgi:hypothetical protein